MNEIQLKEKATALRLDILEMIYRANTGHIGGDYSVLDTLVCLYNGVMNISPETQDDPNRDRFIMSKGHAVEALYAVLADKGFFDRNELIEQFSTFKSPFIGHPNNELPGIEMNTGSLGHGLPVGVGMALAAKMDNADYRVYVVMGDGEQAEGSVWEAYTAAAHFKLDNLVAIVDRNHLQISGNTEDVMASGNLTAKLKEFGWDVTDVEDGNDIGQLMAAFENAKKREGKPHLIVAHTVKGKGVSFMENQAGWHHHVPNEEQYKLAITELKGESK